MSANAELVQATIPLPNTLIVSPHKSLLDSALGLAISVSPTETQAGTFTLRVSHLHAGSVALLSGSVRPNDVLIAINGTKVQSIADAERVLQAVVEDGLRHVPVLLCRRMPRERSSSLRGVPGNGTHASSLEGPTSMLFCNSLGYSSKPPPERRSPLNASGPIDVTSWRGERTPARFAQTQRASYDGVNLRNQQQLATSPVSFNNSPRFSPNSFPVGEQRLRRSDRRSGEVQFVTERHAAAWNQNNQLSVTDANQQLSWRPPSHDQQVKSTSAFAGSPLSSNQPNLSRRRSIHSVTPLASTGASPVGSASPVLLNSFTRQPPADSSLLITKILNSPSRTSRLPRKFPKYFALFMLNTSTVRMQSSSPTTSVSRFDSEAAASSSGFADDIANNLSYVHPQSNSSILKSHGAFITLWQLCADLRIGRPTMLTVTVAEREVQIECCALPNDDKILFLALSKRTSLHKALPLMNLVSLLEFLYGNVVLALEHPLFTAEATNVITNYIAVISASSTPPCPDGNYECDLLDDEPLRARVYAALNRLQSEIYGPSTAALPLASPFASPSLPLDVLPVWCRGVCLMRRPHQQQTMLLLTTLPEHVTQMCLLASRLSRSVFPADSTFMRELYRLAPSPRTMLTTAEHHVYKLHAASTSYLLIVKVGEISLAACFDALLKNLTHNLTIRNRIYQHALSILHEIVQHLARARHQSVAQRAHSRVEMMTRMQRGGVNASSRATTRHSKQSLSKLRSKSAENLSFDHNANPDDDNDDDEETQDAETRTASTTNLHVESATTAKVLRNAETALENPCLVALTNRHNVSVASDLLESYQDVLSQPVRQLPRLLLPSIPTSTSLPSPSHLLTLDAQGMQSTYYAEFGISCTIKTNKHIGIGSSTSDLLNKIIHPANELSSSSKQKRKSNKANIYFQISAATCPSNVSVQRSRIGSAMRSSKRSNEPGGRSVSAGSTSTSVKNNSNYYDVYNGNSSETDRCDIRYSARTVIVPDLRAENQCALRRYGFRTSFS